jgi:hypothetical protein
MPPKTTRQVVPDSPPSSPEHQEIKSTTTIPPITIPHSIPVDLPVVPVVVPTSAPSSAPMKEYVSTSSTLIDLPHFYLLERSQWADFKRNLNNCGLTWNLPDWMYTIVYKGEQYKKVEQKNNLSEIFKLPTMLVGEQKVEVGGGKSQELIRCLGLPKSIGEYIQSSTRYANLNKLDFEPEVKLPARQKLWSWLLKCLYGPKTNPGPYYYLVDQVMVYDICHLFTRLTEIIETVTICSLDDEVYNVTHLEFDPATQNIFGYLEDLRRANQRLNDLNERLPVEGRVILSDSYVRSRLVRAARQIPAYKTVVDQLVIKPKEEWATMSLNSLVLLFENVNANDLSLIPRRISRVPTSSTEDGVQAHHTKISQTKKLCRNVTDYGVCKRTGCTFYHSKPEQKDVTPPVPAAPPAPRRVCGVCEKNHGRGKCEYKCPWCGKTGHKQEKCFDKLSGKPKILKAEYEDGEVLLANLFICDDFDPQPGVCEPIPQTDVVVEEKNGYAYDMVLNCFEETSGNEKEKGGKCGEIIPTVFSSVVLAPLPHPPLPPATLSCEEKILPNMLLAAPPVCTIMQPYKKFSIVDENLIISLAIPFSLIVNYFSTHFWSVSRKFAFENFFSTLCVSVQEIFQRKENYFLTDGVINFSYPTFCRLTNVVENVFEPKIFYSDVLKKMSTLCLLLAKRLAMARKKVVVKQILDSNMDVAPPNVIVVPPPDLPSIFFSPCPPVASHTEENVNFVDLEVTPSERIIDFKNCCDPPKVDALASLMLPLTPPPPPPLVGDEETSILVEKMSSTHRARVFIQTVFDWNFGGGNVFRLGVFVLFILLLLLIMNFDPFLPPLAFLAGPNTRATSLFSDKEKGGGKESDFENGCSIFEDKEGMLCNFIMETKKLDSMCSPFILVIDEKNFLCGEKISCEEKFVSPKNVFDDKRYKCGESEKFEIFYFEVFMAPPYCVESKKAILSKEKALAPKIVPPTQILECLSREVYPTPKTVPPKFLSFFCLYHNKTKLSQKKSNFIDQRLGIYKNENYLLLFKKGQNLKFENSRNFSLSKFYFIADSVLSKKNAMKEKMVHQFPLGKIVGVKISSSLVPKIHSVSWEEEDLFIISFSML